MASRHSLAQYIVGAVYFIIMLCEERPALAVKTLFLPVQKNNFHVYGKAFVRTVCLLGHVTLVKLCLQLTIMT